MNCAYKSTIIMYMNISDDLARKGIALIAVICLALGLTSCSSGSKTTVAEKPSIEESQWLKDCREASNTTKCEDAIAANFAVSTMFFSLSNENDFENILQYAIGPHNVWCFTNEGKCYAKINAFNNSGSRYLDNPTAMITDGDGKFHYAVLDGSVSFDGVSSWTLETEHFFDLNPGQSWRDLGGDGWRAGFNVQSLKMQNLKRLSVGKSTDSGDFAPDGATIPLCKKENSTADLIIYEDCRILNEWDYVNGNYEKKKGPEPKATKKEVQASGAVAGEPCDQAGAKSKTKGLTYTCLKLGKKLYWDNGVADPLKKKNASLIGSTGPGGGVVFYDAGSQQSWGRYLEASTKDIEIKGHWCEQWRILVGATGKVIGSGRSNTEKILNECGSSAATPAQSFRGGGKSDWFLPSIGELSEIFKQKKVFDNLDCSYYWSSTESGENDAWQIVFDNNKVIATEPVDKSGGPECIRPIRAF